MLFGSLIFYVFWLRINDMQLIFTIDLSIIASRQESLWTVSTFLRSILGYSISNTTYWWVWYRNLFGIRCSKYFPYFTNYLRKYSRPLCNSKFLAISNPPNLWFFFLIIWIPVFYVFAPLKFIILCYNDFRFDVWSNESQMSNLHLVRGVCFYQAF